MDLGRDLANRFHIHFDTNETVRWGTLWKMVVRKAILEVLEDTVIEKDEEEEVDYLPSYH
jgi:hypothetical protein